MNEKTVAAKLLIKPKTTVWLSHPDRASLLGPLPEGAGRGESLATADVGFVFADDSASLRVLLDRYKEDLPKPGVFWVAYPKANRIDLNRDKLWPVLSYYGMRPISQVAIDHVWSALRFRELKDGEEFKGGA